MKQNDAIEIIQENKRYAKSLQFKNEEQGRRRQQTCSKKKLVIDISTSNIIMPSVIAVIQVFDKQGKWGRKKYNAVKRKK